MSRIPYSWEDVFDSNGDPNLISSELLMDMLKSSFEKSKLAVTLNRCSFALWEMKNYRKVVTFIFELISDFGIQDPYVRYNTCDLYEKFLEEHIEATKDVSTDQDFKDMAICYLIACIMLSTKISSSASIKHIDLYSRTIKQTGHECSKKAITNTEVLVMKTVNYKIDQCPIAAICPMLILTLVYNEPAINGKLLYSLLHKTMDFYYLAKADILSRLNEILEDSRKFSKEEFKRFIADALLMASAVIAVTPMLIDERLGPMVLKELVYITCYDPKDIEVIRNVILEGILDKEIESEERSESTESNGDWD